ncbi:MAG: TolC family protein [Candidatus Thioglobus sp.]|nr:MAG: TolC family protein [Candidatus Thioglobus sp.]
MSKVKFMKINLAAALFLLSINALALSEQEFIDKVLSQDAHFEKDQIYVTIKEIELDVSKRIYGDWNAALASSVSKNYYDVKRDSSSRGAYQKHYLQNSKSVGLTATKRFLTNPSSLTLSARRAIVSKDIERYKKHNPHDKYNLSTSGNIYKLGYKYPLLKHDSNASSLKTYNRNILSLEREKLDFADAQEKLLAARLEQFINWNFYQKSADIYKNYLQLLKTIKDKQGNRSKLKTAILRANQDLSDNNSKLQALKKSLIGALNDDSLWAQKPKISANKTPKIVADLDNYLRQNSRTLLKYDIDKRLKKIDLVYHKNQSLYKLDLGIAAEKFNGGGNTLSTNYYNRSIFYSATIDFSMPIGANIGNQKDIQVAQLNLRKLNIDYDNKFNDILADAKALIVELDLAKTSLDSYQKLISSVASDSKMAQQDYSKNFITLKTLIETYQDKRDVELDYIGALTNYQKSLLEYKDKLDIVLVQN